MLSRWAFASFLVLACDSAGTPDAANSGEGGADSVNTDVETADAPDARAALIPSGVASSGPTASGTHPSATQPEPPMTTPAGVGGAGAAPDTELGAGSVTSEYDPTESGQPQSGEGGQPERDAGSPATGEQGTGATTDTSGSAESSSTTDLGRADGGAQPSSPNNCVDVADYDTRVLCDGPVAYWALSTGDELELDLSGNGHDAEYQGGTPDSLQLPNGDAAASFDGESQYLSVSSAPEFSIPTTGTLTWEAWIRPSTLDFPHNSNDYVDWMGKCEQYSPTCEWEARMYNASSERCSRLSAYAFNPGADLGSGAYFQTECGTIEQDEWLYVVGQYTLLAEPEACDSPEQYPGSVEIWVNGVKWAQSRHGQTGCMSQYQVAPKANASALNIGTMAGDSWFQGAIGKVAIYDKLLDAGQIVAHYRQMTASEPHGSCEDECSF